MNRIKGKLLVSVRMAVYALAFLGPPLLVGVLGMNVAEAGRYEGPPDTKIRAGELPTPPEHDPDKPTAVVLLSNRGAEVTDVLAPYEVLSESGAFNVYAAAPERKTVPLSGGLDVLPQLSLSQLDQRLGGEAPDVIVVPAMPGVGTPEHRPVAGWLEERAEGGGTVVSVCNGAEVLADAGLLAGRRATANWAGIGGWEERYPDTEWVRGRRYVEDGNVITAAGVTSGVGAALRVVRGYVGEEAATGLAREIGYPDRRLGGEPRIPARRLTASDATLYVLGAAYGWGRPEVGVLLTEGVSEIELASVLDVYPGQAYTAHATTLAPEGPGTPVRSEHGLLFVPRSGLSGAPSLDQVLVPGRDAPSATEPGVQSWARDRGLTPEYVHADAPAGAPASFPFDATLSDLAERENEPVARFTAKGLEYPTGGLELSGDGWPFFLLLRPLAVGVLGLTVAVAIGRLLSSGIGRLHRGPAAQKGPGNPTVESPARTCS